MNEHRPSLTRTEHRLSVEGGIRRLSGVAPGTVCAGKIQCAGYSGTAIQLESGSTRLWRLVCWQPLFDPTTYAYIYAGSTSPYSSGYYDFQYDYGYLSRQYTGKDFMWAVVPDAGVYPTYEYLTGTMTPTITVAATSLFVATDIKPDMNLTGIVSIPTPVYGSDSLDYEIGSTVWALSPGI